MRRPPRGFTQDSVDRRTLERDLDTFSGRIEVWQSGIETTHGGQMSGAHLLQVSDVDELGEVIHHRGSAQMRAGGTKPALIQCLVPQLLMHRGRGRPRAAPVIPGLQSAHHPVEIRGGHAIGREPGTPVRAGGGYVFVHVLNSSFPPLQTIAVLPTVTSRKYRRKDNGALIFEQSAGQ